MKILRITAVLIALLVAIPGTLPAQTSVGGTLGLYDQGGEGGHPFVHALVAVEAEQRLWRGLWLGAEWLHVPTLVGSRAWDLFALRPTLRLERRGGDVRPYVLAAMGSTVWREWACRNGSCDRQPTNLGDRFRRLRGLGGSLGAGVRIAAAGPLVLDMGARWEWAGHSPVGPALAGLFGLRAEF